MKNECRPFVSVVVVAAGRGTRMKMEGSKQYISICGKPLLTRTLEAFQRCEAISEIVLVVNSQDIVFCKQVIIDAYELYKVKTIVAGGEERQNSVFNGLKELDKRSEIVLIHDGARPFIEEDVLIDSIHAALEYKAACLGVPVKDTIKTVSKEGFIDETPERALLWAIQTPQAFQYNLIMKAHIEAINEQFIGTDDAVLVERLGVKVKIVMGSYYNIKITTQEDIAFAEAIIEQIN